MEYFKIEDNKFGVLGWGWYALTKYTIQIPKEDKLAGIRLRSHNIQVGDANLLSGTKYWKEDRSNSFLNGDQAKSVISFLCPYNSFIGFSSIKYKKFFKIQ